MEDLERMGRLTGVVDDRGKFIHVEPAEMEKVRSVCAWCMFLFVHVYVCIDDGRWLGAPVYRSTIIPRTSLTHRHQHQKHTILKK